MTKIDEIVKILQQELAEGIYQPGERFPSEYELVRRFEVSRGTVNKAVSMLCECGWLRRGRRGAGTTVLKKSANTARSIVYLGTFSKVFSTQILVGVTRTAFQRGYLCTALHPQLVELSSCLEKIIAGNQYQGIVTSGYQMLPDDLPIPVVYIDEGIPHYLPDRHYVVNRNYDGGAMMMKELWARGHREIVVAANSSYLQTHRWHRVQGFMDTLRKLQGGDPTARFYAAVEGTVLEARLLLEKILHQHPRVTAIATDCDDLAFVLAAAARQLGIAQDKLVITGYGNLLGFMPGIDEVHNMPSVEQNPFLLGSVACDTLLDLVEGKHPADKPVMRYVDVSLVRTSAIFSVPPGRGL